MADFCEQRSGRSVSDPATAALRDLAGDVHGLRLLEVACGQGRVARELARRGAALTGVDISAALLANVARWLRPAGRQYRLPRPGRLQPPDDLDVPQLADRARAGAGVGR
jgi:2-polyprenyl-3-methyl-5-hydroxy-6-metoxy-1,4-benzoquinol methylase